VLISKKIADFSGLNDKNRFCEVVFDQPFLVDNHYEQRFAGKKMFLVIDVFEVVSIYLSKRKPWCA